MTSSTSAPINASWPLNKEMPTADASSFPAPTDATPVELGARAPLAALTMLRDSARILGAFAWGKHARLSRNKSAELCALMDGWHGIE